MPYVYIRRRKHSPFEWGLGFIVRQTSPSRACIRTYVRFLNRRNRWNTKKKIAIVFCPKNIRNTTNNATYLYDISVISEHGRTFYTLEFFHRSLRQNRYVIISWAKKLGSLFRLELQWYMFEGDIICIHIYTINKTSPTVG